MTSDQRLQAECERAVQAEQAMRKLVGQLEELNPNMTRLTVSIRHAMIEMLSFVNAVRTSLAAQRMVGEVPQVPPLESVEDTPLFAGKPMSVRLGAKFQEDQVKPEEWQEIWTGERIAAVPAKLEKRMEQSRHRAGDHTQDREGEAA